MKFCYKEGSEHIATKCIRVSCTATTTVVIEALVEKFRPDMRMLLGATSYALYECHEAGNCFSNMFSINVVLRAEVIQD